MYILPSELSEDCILSIHMWEPGPGGEARAVKSPGREETLGGPRLALGHAQACPRHGARVWLTQGLYS